METYCMNAVSFSKNPYPGMMYYKSLCTRGLLTTKRLDGPCFEVVSARGSGGFIGEVAHQWTSGRTAAGACALVKFLFGGTWVSKKLTVRTYNGFREEKLSSTVTAVYGMDYI